MNGMSVRGLQEWAAMNYELGLAVVAARVHAELERKRVDEYIRPVFEGFEFLDDEGKRILNERHIFACPDEELCAKYYAACDKAHRAHGFDGPEGHCPALIAEHEAMKAEQALLVAAARFMGVDPAGFYGKNREKALELFVALCVQRAGEEVKEAA